MGWGRTLFLGDIGNRLDIGDCENEVARLRRNLDSQSSVANTKTPWASVAAGRSTKQSKRPSPRRADATVDNPRHPEMNNTRLRASYRLTFNIVWMLSERT